MCIRDRLIPYFALFASTIALYFVTLNKEPIAAEQVREVEVLDYPVIDDEVVKSAKVTTKVEHNKFGLAIIESDLNEFDSVNSLSNGKIQFTYLDEQGVPVPGSAKIDYRSDYRAEIGLHEYTKKLRICGQNLPDRPDIFEQNGTYVVGFKNGYWGNYVVGKGKIKASIKQDKFVLDIDDPTQLYFISLPMTIPNLQALSKESGTDLVKLLKLNQGFLWGLKGFVLYYTTLLFEAVYKLVSNPLLAIMLIMLAFKLITAYGSYRAFIFGIEFKKISELSKKPNGQELMMKALQKVNFPEQIVYMIIRIAILLTIYAVIQGSPYFFKSRFLWISDLSMPDTFGITNLFGLIKQPSFLPVIGLTPILAVLGIAYEVLYRNKSTDDQNQYLMYGIIAVAAFTLSRIQSSLCLFIFTSSLIDQLQNYAFAKIRRRKK